MPLSSIEYMPLGAVVCISCKVGFMQKLPVYNFTYLGNYICRRFHIRIAEIWEGVNALSMTLGNTLTRWEIYAAANSWLSHIQTLFFATNICLPYIYATIKWILCKRYLHAIWYISNKSVVVLCGECLPDYVSNCRPVAIIQWRSENRTVEKTNKSMYVWFLY